MGQGEGLRKNCLLLNAQDFPWRDGCTNSHSCYSDFCVRRLNKENKNNDDKIKENWQGGAWRSMREKNREESNHLGRAKEGMNQPILSCPFLPLLCNCGKFSGFLNSVTFTYIMGQSFC